MFLGVATTSPLVQADDIIAARELLLDVISPTPMLYSRVLAEQVGGIDREQDRLALALIGSEFLTFECDEQGILPLPDEVAGARARRDEGRQPRISASMRSWHDAPPFELA